MEEFIKRYNDYREYLEGDEKDEKQYLNLKDFMYWIENGFVYHE